MSRDDLQARSIRIVSSCAGARYDQRTPVSGQARRRRLHERARVKADDTIELRRASPADHQGGVAPMTPEEREAYLSQPRNATLATVSANGRIHAVPVWFRYEGGAFEIFTERSSVKHRNAARAGRAALCVDDGQFAYVSAEGPVEV